MLKRANHLVNGPSDVVGVLSCYHDLGQGGRGGLQLLLQCLNDDRRIDKVPMTLVTEPCALNLVCEGAALNHGELVLQMDVVGEDILF